MSPYRATRKKRSVKKSHGVERRKFNWRQGKWISGLLALFALVFLVTFIQFGGTPVKVANASPTENVEGFLWSDYAGWISMNSVNPCGQPLCGDYGVNVDPNTREIKGFAWSDVAGWVCFGSSCAAHPACAGAAPSGLLTAQLDFGSGVLKARGWAKVCNQGDKGWISLNCEDLGTCGSHNYNVSYNTLTKWFQSANPPAHPVITSLAWNGNSDGSGFGYIDFEYAHVNLSEICTDGVDNDMSGAADCADTACAANPSCEEKPGNVNAFGVPLCKDGLDDDGNGPIDCADPKCSPDPVCLENGINTNFAGVNLCADGLDDNGNGKIDCVDPGCAAFPGCAVIGEAASNPDIHLACSDGVDNDGNGPVDCADVNCQSADPACVPAWIEAKFGNVYAQQGIQGDLTSKSKGTYCLTTSGAISNFGSTAGCSEQGQPTLTLPKSSTGYQGTLGSLDIRGILAGRFGKVVELAPGDITVQPQFLATLGGNVYHVAGNAVLNARNFLNGAGGTGRGNGLLIVEGDLNIIGDLGYQPAVGVTALRNLASFGVIVKKNAVGAGGNITLQPSVSKISGAFFAEDTIYTGTSGGVDITPLQVFGLLAARQIKLERNYLGHPATAAETVIFDGRAVANPPPGMSDIPKSLPLEKDAF
ncbi:MAG: hypothetical protein WC641_05475 [Patescibacteria group bacterium]